MEIFYPIQLLADGVVYSALGISKSDHMGDVIHFFIYDTIKILLLLSVIVFVVSIIRTFLPQERIKNIISRQHLLVGHILAGLLGIITPFCSCSAVPLFLGFLEAGIPLGVTFTFLVASPMINEIALIMLSGMFGFKIALIYVVSGLVIAIGSGLIISRLRVEGLLTDFVHMHAKLPIMNKTETFSHTWNERIRYSFRYTQSTVLKVLPYLLVGTLIGAFIHGFVPSDLLARYAGSDNIFAVPVAVLIGIPLYSNVAGVIPLVSVLTEKGVAIGTTLAFMMAITGLSLPEFMILKRVMKLKLIMIFASIVGIGIIITGYLFNYLLK